MILSMHAGAEDMLVTFSVVSDPGASAWDVAAAVLPIQGADCMRDPKTIQVHIEPETTFGIRP